MESMKFKPIWALPKSGGNVLDGLGTQKFSPLQRLIHCQTFDFVQHTLKYVTHYARCASKMCTVLLSNDGGNHRLKCHLVVEVDQ